MLDGTGSIILISLTDKDRFEETGEAAGSSYCAFENVIHKLYC